jgi:molybdopterin converting factor small subunit
VAVSLLGAGIFLATAGLTEAVPVKTIRESVEKTENEDNPAVSLLTVKVVYFQMAQYVNTGAEYFVLQAPATLRDLLTNVAERHPSLTSMIPNMWILMNGAPAKLSAPLKDGEEVDLIPLVAGG